MSFPFSFYFFSPLFIFLSYSPLFSTRFIAILICADQIILLFFVMVVIASRNILSGVPEGGASAVMRSEIPAPYPLGRSRSLADVHRSNSHYAKSQFSPTVVPIGMPSKPISVHQPYWTYSAYWPNRYFRNFNTYDNQITDSFYWHYPFRRWTSFKHNWYQYDSPYYYRRYHDYYNIFYNTELLSYGNRSKMMENLYQETPLTH